MKGHFSELKKLLVPLLLCIALCTLSSCSQNAGQPSPSAPEPPSHTVSLPLEDPTGITPTEVQGQDEKNEETRVSFLGCGDNIVYYGNVLEATAVAVGGRRYDFRPTYAGVADMIASADIAMINQETVMDDKQEYSYYPRFNGPSQMGLDLVDIGFDVISMANNHMLDKDSEGLWRTIEFWRKQPVTLIGGYHTEEEYNTAAIVEKNGIRIAFLAYTYGTNGISPDGKAPVVLPLFNEQTVMRQIKAAKEISDFVIVSAHWGDEDKFTPTEMQKKYAYIMTEAGADAIIGHHPHVIQPIEWLQASDGRKTLCVYSLGNFAAEQAYDYNMLGGMISFDIVKDENGTKIESPVFHPTVYYFNVWFRNNYIFPLEKFTPALASSHGITTYDNTITVEGIQKYLNSTIDKEFLK